MMGIHRVMGVMVLAALTLVLGACTTNDTSTNSPDDVAGIEKTSIEPDSVKGDTTFYSAIVRPAAYTLGEFEESTWKFATWDGYWHMREHVYGDERKWVKVTLYLNLYTGSRRDSVRAEAVIEQLGGTVTFRGSSPWGLAYTVALTADTSMFAKADLPYLDYLKSYSEYRDVFPGVQPQPHRYPGLTLPLGE